MTTKKKAKELFDKYYPLASSYVDDRHGVAKQCAKIAVEEILKNSVMNYSGSDFSNNEILSDIDYWIEVKKEINEL